MMYSGHRHHDARFRLSDIIESVELDGEGMISYEELRDAYENWRIRQMEIPSVQALFNMLWRTRTFPRVRVPIPLQGQEVR